MTESRSGLSSSASARATASMTVAGRNAPASSWASVVRRASNSGAARGVAGLEGGLGMILANVRGRLRAQDFLLVALALAHGDTPHRQQRRRDLPLSGRHGGGPHGARRRRGTGLLAARASRQLQPLARGVVSGLHRRSTLPQRGARFALLRRAGSTGLSARRGAPARRAPRRRHHLPFRR